MILVKTQINGKTFYSVNGYHVRKDAIEAIASEIFTQSAWLRAKASLEQDGFVNIPCVPAHTARDILKELDDANKKIADLKQQLSANFKQ